MRVICINDSWKPAPGAMDHPHPVFGEECTVTETFDFRCFEWFKLAGYGGDAFRIDMFSPLGGRCEVAILEERADQEIAHLDKTFRDLVHEVENA